MTFKGHKHTEESKRKLSKAHKGQKAWNKGTKGLVKPNSGSFKKGLKPWNKNTHIQTNTGRTHIKKGAKLSDETCKRMSLAKTGVKFSQERVDRMKGRTSPMKGKKHTEEAKRKISESHKGDKAYQWKGGITPKIKAIRNSPEMKQWRKAIFKRDGYKCQMPRCGKKERYLNAHHIKRFADYPELRFDINNGITLCKKCHNKLKGKEKEEKFEELFNKIIKKNAILI